jgi:hypothetical protein
MYKRQKLVNGIPNFPLLAALAGSILGIIFGLGDVFFNGKIPPWLIVFGLSCFAIIFPWNGEDKRPISKCFPCLIDCKCIKTCKWGKDRNRDRDEDCSFFIILLNYFKRSKR